MRLTVPALCALALLACPERQAPERGLQLVYKKPSEAPLRTVVDRRLAQLKLRANLQEDGSTLTVRVPEGADVSRLKALLATPGLLEFCAEDVNIGARWCEAPWRDGVVTEDVGASCALKGPRQALEAALPDAGSEVAWGRSGQEAWAIGDCESPRIISAEARDEPPSVMLEFDKQGGRDFGALTRTLVGHRLIIRLDGVVTTAPVVREAITGGKAMLTTTALDRAGRETLAASLVGGALPALVLEREGTWGPPSLSR